MSPRDRFIAALNGQPVGKPPLAHIAAMTTVEIQEATGITMPSAHVHPEKMAGLMGANYEILGFDAITIPINFFNEPATLDVEMNWGDTTTLPACLSHPWQNKDDAQMPVDFLERLPVGTCLDAVALGVERYGDTIGVMGKVMGPLSMVQMMHGVEQTMVALATDPDKISHFMDVAMQAIMAFGRAQFDRGIDALAVGEGGAGAHMLSPEMYEQYVLPLHKRLVKNLPGPIILHMCGDITPRLDMLARPGLTCFNFDWAIPPDVMAESAKGMFSLMGNISTSDLLNGSPDIIKAQVRKNLDAGVNIISPGCAISPKCPNANLAAMRDAIDEWFAERNVNA